MLFRDGNEGFVICHFVERVDVSGIIEKVVTDDKVKLTGFISPASVVPLHARQSDSRKSMLPR